MARFSALLAVSWVLLMTGVVPIDVNFKDLNSVKAAAKTIADDLITNYIQNTTTYGPNLLAYPPYFWWESGAMWGVMIDYWFATNDSTYNDMASTAIQAQVGDDQDFMPLDQAFDMGNDDQDFWAITALDAAESNFQNPSKEGLSWLGLAQAVYNEQIGRWDNTTCGGGMHWQVSNQSGSYKVKNTIANGGLMQIAARLARYTQDDQYAKWATKLWDWMWAVGLIDNENWSVYDNTDSSINCSAVDRHLWTYNVGTVLVACATMYNYTGGDVLWGNRVSHLLSTLLYDYFPNGIMRELCEGGTCDTDQLTFKAYLSRWMAMSTQLAPFTIPQIMPVLQSSAVAAMKQCSGTYFPNNCGLQWTMNSTWDGTNGPGQQMAALEIVLSTIIKSQPVLLTNSTGGTSVSNPSAGLNKSSADPGSFVTPATHRDQVGAWFITVLIALATFASCFFLWSTIFEPHV